MAHLASELDIKRILKYSTNYLLDKNDAKELYSGGNIIVCDNNPKAFCYPVRYLDGILIRYFSHDPLEVFDMCKLFVEHYRSKVYISNILDENINAFKDIGFTSTFRLFQLYKDIYNYKPSDSKFIILDYDPNFLGALLAIDTSTYPLPWQITEEDIGELCTDNNKIRLCIYNNKCVGFSIFKINKVYGYCYIIKIVVDKPFQPIGVGSALINDICKSLLHNNISFIFTDTIFQESADLFKRNGFKIYSKSNLLIKN
jgi:GNAT superfamily N-acetyltransferase